MIFAAEIGFGLVEVEVNHEDGELDWPNAKITYKGIQVNDIIHDEYKEELYEEAKAILASGFA
jgi:hypothetical protein